MNVEINLLGGFQVSIGGQPVPADAWRRRQAAGLVKVLALAPRRTLHREQVMNRLWPDLAPEAAGPRLHKAAHYARRVLGPGGLVLRSENVHLFPDTTLTVDVDRFRELAARALAGDGIDPAGPGTVADPEPARVAEQALAAYRGPLLPEDRYETWAGDERDRLALRHRQLLRLAGRWQELADLDPTDEPAQLALMRELAARGDRRAALRHFERLDRALQRELGVGPSETALALRDELLAALAGPVVRPPADLVGREGELARIGTLLAAASDGRARTVLISGPPGVGKSALLDAVRREASARQWYTGYGVAAAVEGAWPYAPALEALADLCRRHPALLDGLDDRYRDELDRALAGGDLVWAGDGGHQRLFVAAAELARLAASGDGAMLIIDDVHEADDASLRLLHYLARSCARERLVLVLAHRRQPVTDTFEEVRASLLGRLGAVDLPLAPLDRDTTAALVRQHRGEPLPRELMDQLWAVSGGLPFAVVELARSLEDGPAPTRPPGAVPLGMLSPAIKDVLEHIAVTGTSFDTDEFLSLSGMAESAAFDCLDAALAALVLERTPGGYRFRHPLIREALLAELPQYRQQSLHRSCANRLIALDASPARICHHLLAAGDPVAAAPYARRAAERAAAVGAYLEALRLVESVRSAATGRDRARLYALRADLLAATGDPAAAHAYREALEWADETGRRDLRARLGRMAVLSGDLATAAAALAGLQLDGGPTDATILLARGSLAYFQGDRKAAWRATEDAYRMVANSGDDWQALDLLTLQGLLAHHEGTFLHRMRQDLQRTRHDPGLATAVFDAQLCVVEIMLYGPMPYPEVIEFADDLRRTALRAGALRAVAFAAVVKGEAALLSGDLELAERELREAADLHREIAAPAGEAVALQRLAELYVVRGDRDTANRILQRALPLARWSALALHLLQRIYGTMVLAAANPAEAREVVARVEAGQGLLDQCLFCDITFAVPAAIACAEVGDLEAGRRYLVAAERSAGLWEGTTWQAMILEAKAHLTRAGGEEQEAQRLLTRAGQIFADAGQPLDADRCRGKLAAGAGAGRSAEQTDYSGHRQPGHKAGDHHDRQTVAT